MTSIFAWVVIDNREGPFPWFFFSPVLLGAGGLFVAGCVQLFTYRRIEIYPKERKLVSLKRTPFGGVTREVHGFDELRRISVSWTEPTDDSPGTSVVVILTMKGAVDFGNHSLKKGGHLAARLHELTGLPVGK